MSARPNRGRIAAARTLSGVDEGGFAEDLLNDSMPEGSDGNLAWHLVFGTLRHRAEVDAALRGCLKQPIAQLDVPVRAVLRVGAFEKLHSRTPDHAVVSQWVEVARKVGAKRATGLVNAILRRVKPAPKMSLPDRLNHPAWLVARWVDRYGEDATTAWCERNNTIAPVCFVGPESDEPVILDGEPLERTRMLQPGRLDLERLAGGWVMDPAAVRVADRFADAVGEGRVLDAAASPGGKSMRLASRGLSVTATDLPARLPRLRENVARLGLDIEVSPADWTTANEALGEFAGVLLDAPCTGLGTLRRHPEIRWRRQEADLAQSADRQLALLTSVAQRVQAGGVLGYAVCSPEPEEGNLLVERFLATAPGFQLESGWVSAPPTGEEDAHQVYICRRI